MLVKVSLAGLEIWNIELSGHIKEGEMIEHSF